MYKTFALVFIGVGIYLGLNYSNEIESIMDADAFERVQEKAEDATNAFMDKIDEFKG
ncbi:hypothetical protein [Vibrio lentus]|uniref:hypothetical protein n=1 Tax=Vibrio lentus TaxID=136468 RepID=UPI0018E492A9|nr:hypothetical protein [Vibrio lentus]